MKMTIKQIFYIRQTLKVLGLQLVCFAILYVYKLSVVIAYIVEQIADETYFIHLCLTIQYIFWIHLFRHYLNWEKKVSYVILILGLLFISSFSCNELFEIPTIIKINNPIPLFIYDIEIIITLNIYLFVASVIMYYTIVSIKKIKYTIYSF